MPIPLLFIGTIAGTAAVGAGKTIKAGIDQRDAKRTNECAKWVIDDAKEKIDKCRTNCGKEIEALGNRKLYVLDDSIKLFVQEFEKLNHIELKKTKGLNELQKIVLEKKSFEELKEMQTMASSITSGVVSGAMAGALTAFGAYGAASTFACASTGTAIASLSGAAASNATLAFFGGGSIATGGLGVAGGTAVLGGLVAGPALAIMGFIVGAKASKNKEEAYENLSKARAFEEEMNVASAVCMGIRKRALMFNRFLISLNSMFYPLVCQMTWIIAEKGNDFRKFSDDEKNVVAEAMAMAGAIKAILDTPILDEEGNLTEESLKMENLMRKQIEKFG